MLVLLYLLLNSYYFLFQIQSSSSTDSPAKSRPRGSGKFCLIQCCNMHFPVGDPAFILSTDTRRVKCVESCDPGVALRKIKCILIHNYQKLHFLDKIIWNVEKTSRDLLSHVSISHVSTQVSLDMCAQSEITRGITWSCMSTYGHKYSQFQQGNKLIWKLPWLILCPIEIIGIIYGKCITFTVCFENIYIYLF
jgi:hypothetical protein